MVEPRGTGIYAPVNSKVTDKSKRRDAQQFIFTNWEQWYASNIVTHPNKKDALRTYCHQYNSRSLNLPDIIYKKVKKISVATLYRWKKELYTNNELFTGLSLILKDEGILMPFNTSLNKMQINFILKNYLHQGKPGILTVYNLLKMNRFMGGPGVSYITAYRYIKNFEKYNRGLVVLARDGKTAFSNKVMGYIERDWNLLKPDELWVADGHKLDVQVKTPDGKKIKRPTVVIFMDARSRYITGLSLHWTENTSCVLQALAFGLMYNGTPGTILMDNGTSFKNHTMLGQSYDTIKVSGVFDRLGIDPMFAIPGHPQSKHVERLFRTVKDMFSRFWKSYTGGAPQWRPEQNSKLKLDDYPDIYDLYKSFLKWVLIYNTKHEHSALNGRTPYEVYHSVDHKTWESGGLKPLMRQAFIRKVRRNGIRITIQGKEIWYYNKDWCFRLADNGQRYKIYINDYDLDSVDVHDKDDNHLFTAKAKQKLSPLARHDEAHREAISTMMAENRHSLKAARQQLEVIQEFDVGSYKDMLSGIEVPMQELKEDHNWQIDEDLTGDYLPNEHEDRSAAQDLLLNSRE